ncbi:MAG: N-acetylmuramoyl-L-alanine amidase, partial [Elusimicrobia bacterium]|nr:N-acetylmuramoyl-L-alanine amidase [Elusimicrobiota bacterium]
IKKYKRPLKLVVDIQHSTPVNMTKPREIYLADTVAETDKQINENRIEKKVKKTGKPADTADVKDIKQEQVSDIEVPIMDKKVISDESEVLAAPDEKEYADDDSTEKVAKMKTVVVADDNIVDNSYTLVDDTESFKDIMPVVKKKDISKDAKVIVLDAGHGGHDPGAVGPHGVKEKDINLAIILQLEKIFKRDKDFKVILTRDNDKFIPLVKRADIANTKKADLFISVHCNSNLKRESSGFEVYFLSENASDTEAFSTQTLENSVIALEDADDEKTTALQKLLWSMAFTEYINESSELASFISGESTGRLKIPNRGTKQANFYVLRGTQMASVLVECAYLSNYTEEAKLQKSSFQKAVADSIYEGVKKYYARKAKENK